MTTVYTIGHSNRSATALIELLTAHDIRALLDIRAFPRSRRHPHFNRAALEGTLASHDIAYHWSGDTLGGFRKPRADSSHTALTDAAFRGFADYMESEQFHTAIANLIELAARQRLVIMCAESDYRHCHRQFIADYLSRYDVAVNHINSPARGQAHRLNPCLDNASRPPVYNRHEQGDLFG